MKEKKYPHSKNCVRLGISKVHGIGVFAIVDIPANTNIFSDDVVKIVWISEKKLNELNIEPAKKKMYTDFCIYLNGKYGVPENFNSIIPGWYINEPTSKNQVNVYADKNYNFFAKRRIREGEELFVQYTTFSNKLKRY